MEVAVINDKIRVPMRPNEVISEKFGVSSF